MKTEDRGSSRGERAVSAAAALAAFVLVSIAGPPASAGQASLAEPTAANGSAAAPGVIDPSAAEPATDDATLPPEATLDDLLRYAERHSPILRAAEHRHRASLEEIDQVSALPDPTIEVMAAAVHVETRVGPQEGGLTVAQMVPGRSKRRVRAEVARESAEMQRREIDSERFLLHFEVTAAYADLYYLARAIRITEDNRDLLVHLEQSVRKSYEAGKAAYADLIRSQVEIGRLENELASLGDLRRSAGAALNSLLHRPTDALLPEPRIAALPLALKDDEHLRRTMEAVSPELRVIDARQARDERALREAQIADRPDWMFSLTWVPTGPAIDPSTPDSGRDPLMAGIALNIPLWKKKYRARERQAVENRHATRQERLSSADRLRAQLERALYRFRNADREVRLFRDTLLPKAEQSFEASETGFRTGTVSVLDLVDAQRGLLQFELQYERALSERLRALAELRMLVGGEVLVEEDASI